MAKSPFTNQEVPEDNIFAGNSVGFSSPLEVAALPPDQLQEQYVAEILQANTEKADSGGITEDDLEMTARAFIDGLWLNKSEEAGSYIAATAIKILNPDLVQGKSISNIASEMKTQLEAESSTFAEENPATSLVANIAGGVISPVSLAGGRVISEAAKLRKSAQAAQAGDEVTSALGSQFGRQAEQAEDDRY